MTGLDIETLAKDRDELHTNNPAFMKPLNSRVKGRWALKDKLVVFQSPGDKCLWLKQEVNLNVEIKKIVLSSYISYQIASCVSTWLSAPLFHLFPINYIVVFQLILLRLSEKDSLIEVMSKWFYFGTFRTKLIDYKLAIGVPWPNSTARYKAVDFTWGSIMSV